MSPDAIIGSLVLALYVFALLFLFVGMRVVKALPAVRTLAVKSETLSLIPLGHGIQRNVTIGVVCSRLLFDYIDTNQRNIIPAEDQRRSMCHVIVMVCYKLKNLWRLVTELQVYTFLVLILGAINLLKNVGNANAPITTRTILSWLGNDPFHFLGGLEAFVVLFFCIRLWTEYLSIRHLVSE